MALESIGVTEGTDRNVAVDTVGAVDVPVGKVLLGADGVDGGLVSTANPMPVSGTVAVSGTVPVSAASLPLPTSAATETSVAATSTAIGTQADSAAGTDTGAASLISLFKRLLSRLTTLLPQSGGRLDVNVGASAAIPVTDNSGSLTVDGTVSLTDISNGDYKTVAAGQTDTTLGATGAAGDYLAEVLIVPATTSPGAVSIKDGAGSAITIFTGGTTSLSNLVPFPVPIGAKSLNGAWKVTTGANVSVFCTGNFT